MSKFRRYPSTQASAAVYHQDHHRDDIKWPLEHEDDDEPFSSSNPSTEDNPVEYLDKFIRQNSFDGPMADQNPLDPPSYSEIHQKVE